MRAVAASGVPCAVPRGRGKMQSLTLSSSSSTAQGRGQVALDAFIPGTQSPQDCLLEFRDFREQG